jgi:hypothetical protein
MASDDQPLADPPAEWFKRPPAAFDIVTCNFPERDPEPQGSVKLRPALVLSVLREKGTGRIALKVAYGTTVLKLMQRSQIDLIIQNAQDMRIMGLPRATRFDLDELATLPWCPPYFDCWPTYKTPVIGTLIEDYARDLAWLMLKREQR